MKNLYDTTSVEMMQAAEDASGYCSNRVEEIRKFALASGFTKIGIANCITFSHETQVLKAFFAKDFDVFCVDCKYGRLSKQELLGGSSRKVLCNPAGQADFLNTNNCDLNISVGLCVGHDMVFNRLSAAPVTNLFVKDFTNNHDSAAAVSEIQQKSRGRF